jgi:MFS family permease
VGKLDRDLTLIFVAIWLYALGLGLFFQLLYPYALTLGASRFAIGVLNAITLAVMAASYIPGAWAAGHFRLKPTIVWIWWLLLPTSLSYLLAPSWVWLIPGLILFGLSYANNPALKAYIVLKSEPQRVARNMTLVFAAYPLGLIVAPTIGGQLAATYGMRTVFALSTLIFIASSVVVTLIKDTPYHAYESEWSFASLWSNRLFRGYLLFFLIAYLASYLAQPFLTPFLAQAHHQGYAALGVYASLAAVGAALIGPMMGRVTDLYGARNGAGGVLAFLLVGALLLVVGHGPVAWGIAFFCYGAYDALRAVESGIVGRSFVAVPLAWGFAIFESIMGIPMAGASVLGGLLYRQSYRLPFVVVAVLATSLLIGLAVWPRGWRRGRASPPAPTSTR